MIRGTNIFNITGIDGTRLPSEELFKHTREKWHRLLINIEHVDTQLRENSLGKFWRVQGFVDKNIVFNKKFSGCFLGEVEIADDEYLNILSLKIPYKE